MSAADTKLHSAAGIKFTKLILNNKFGGGNRMAHEVVYSQVGNLPAFRKRMDEGAPELMGMLDFDRSGDDDDYTEMSCRIAYIYQWQRQLLATAHNLFAPESDESSLIAGGIEFGTDERIRAKSMLVMGDEKRKALGKQLRRVHDCAPRQGVCIKRTDAELPISCGQYRLCPWCRYALVRRIIVGLQPSLADDMEICLTTYTVPWHPDLDLDAYRRQHSYILNKVCVRNKAYRESRHADSGDFAVTLPEFIRGADGQWRMFWKTSIVALVKKGSRIPAPVNYADTANDQDAGVALMSNGLHWRWPATNDGLLRALLPVFCWPGTMVESGSNSTEYLTKAVYVAATRLAGDFSRFSPHPEGWIPETGRNC